MNVCAGRARSTTSPRSTWWLPVPRRPWVSQLRSIVASVAGTRTMRVSGAPSGRGGPHHAAEVGGALAAGHVGPAGVAHDVVVAVALGGRLAGAAGGDRLPSGEELGGERRVQPETAIHAVCTAPWAMIQPADGSAWATASPASNQSVAVPPAPPSSRGTRRWNSPSSSMRSWDGTRSPVASPAAALSRIASSSAGVGGEPGCGRTASAASLSVDGHRCLLVGRPVRRGGGAAVASPHRQRAPRRRCGASVPTTGSSPWKPRVWQTSLRGEQRDRRGR